MFMVSRCSCVKQESRVRCERGFPVLAESGWVPSLSCRFELRGAVRAARGGQRNVHRAIRAGLGGWRGGWLLVHLARRPNDDEHRQCYDEKGCLLYTSPSPRDR